MHSGTPRRLPLTDLLSSFTLPCSRRRIPRWTFYTLRCFLKMRTTSSPRTSTRRCYFLLKTRMRRCAINHKISRAIIPSSMTLLCRLIKSVCFSIIRFYSGSLLSFGAQYVDHPKIHLADIPAVLLQIASHSFFPHDATYLLFLCLVHGLFLLSHPPYIFFGCIATPEMGIVPCATRLYLLYSSREGLRIPSPPNLVILVCIIIVHLWVRVASFSRTTYHIL